jgi:hypothetical protein
MSLVSTYTDVKFFGESGSTTSDCVAITFVVPAGANPVAVNGYTIPAGGSFAIEQSNGYIDRTRYEFQITSGAGTNQLFVIRIIIKE